MPKPQPAWDEVLVRIAAAGVCHTDIGVYAGVHAAVVTGATTYPAIPGHEWAGYVVQVGEAVAHLRPGDLVVGETGIGCLRCSLCPTGHHNLCPQVTETGILGRDGAIREFHVQKADFVHRFPLDDPELAALVEPVSVAVYACLRALVTPMDRVAVVGGGPIGQFCAQAARAFGATQVTLVTRSEPKLRLAAELGASETINSAEEDVVARAAKLTSGDLFSVVIEAAGTESALNDALRIGGLASRTIVLGLSSPEPLGYPLNTVIHREQTIMGLRGSPNVYPQTIELMSRGAIRGRPVISHRFGVDEVARAFSVARQGGPDVIKVMLNTGP